MFFFKPKNLLGVDIGTTCIKIAEIGKSQQKLKLYNYGWLEAIGHLERISQAIQTPSLKISEKETVRLLKLLLKQMKPKTNQAIVSLPSFAAFITLVEMPLMVPSDTAKALTFQIRQYVPLPVSEITIDWLKVGESENEEGIRQQQIILISVPNEYIQLYRRIFSKAGLKLIALEIESFSLARALARNDPTGTILVDIGGYSTNIAVIDRGFWKYNGRTDFAGISLTQAISSGVNIAPRRAEELKKRYGLLGVGGEYELSTLIFPFLDVIIQEIKRIKEIYENQYKGKIERAVLAGGGANLQGIEKYAGEQLGLPVVVGTPFNNLIYSAELESAISDLGPSLAVAIGLGIKEFVI